MWYVPVWYVPVWYVPVWCVRFSPCTQEKTSDYQKIAHGGVMWRRTRLSAKKHASDLHAIVDGSKVKRRAAVPVDEQGLR